MRHQPLVPPEKTRANRADGALDTEGLCEQVAHLDTSVAAIDEYTRREARQHQHKRAEGKHFYG